MNLSQLGLGTAACLPAAGHRCHCGGVGVLCFNNPSLPPATVLPAAAWQAKCDMPRCTAPWLSPCCLYSVNSPPQLVEAA